MRVSTSTPARASGAFKSIGLKLTGVMFGVVLPGIAVALGVAVLISGSVITRLSLSEAKQNSRAEAMTMDRWLAQQEATMAALAGALSDMEDFSEKQQEAVFKAILEQNKKFVFDVYMGYPSGKATTASGYVFDYSWWSAPNRGWYKLALTDTSRPHTTSPYVDAQTGDLCITTVHAVNRGGKLAGVVAADIFVTTLQEMVLASTMHETGYATLLDKNGDILIHPQEEYAPIKEGDGEFRNLAKVMNGNYAELWKRIEADKGGAVVKYRNSRGVEQYYATHVLPSTGWIFMTVLPAAIVTKPIKSMLLAVVPVALGILALAALLIFFVIRGLVSRPISGLTDAAEKIAAGDLGVSVEGERDDEIGLLMKSFRDIIDSAAEQARMIGLIADGDLTHEVVPRSGSDSLSFALIRMIDITKRQIAVLEHIANGDLTADIVPMCERDAMSLAMRKMIGSLNTMLMEINGAADRVKHISGQTAESAERLSSGSREQAEAVEKLSATIAQITKSTHESAQIAGKAAGFTNTIKADAEQGSRQMDDMTAAVAEINKACADISNVAKTIEDIAFQTNLLALNAAVEAARAGEAGKGFSVVAGEVRSLATKSAASAKDTAKLIEDTLEKANLGSRIARDTANSLAGIVRGINESSVLIRDIAKHSDDQLKAITEINDGIGQVSNVMLQTNATAQESSSASREMSEQADMLESMVTAFTLKSGGGSGGWEG